MYEEQEAVVVLCKCGEVHKTYGIRAAKIAPKKWSFTWTFPVKESSAKREGYDKTSIGGDIGFSGEYPGVRRRILGGANNELSSPFMAS